MESHTSGTQPTRIRFVGHVADELSLAAIDLLQPAGFNVVTLKPGPIAGPLDCVFFTMSDTDIAWPNRWLRLAPHTVASPTWASKTLLRVAVRKNTTGNFRQSLTDAAHRIERWLASGMDGSPFGGMPTGDRLEAFEKWLASFRAAAEAAGVVWYRPPQPAPRPRRMYTRAGRSAHYGCSI